MRKQPAAEIADEASPQLDAPHRSALLRTAAFFILWLVLMQSLKLGGQVWITGINRPATTEPHKMFHVERGLVQEMV